MAIMRSVKSKKTYKECFTALIKMVTPNKHWNPESIGFVCDIYRLISSKSCTRTEREENLVNVFICKRTSKHNECKRLGDIFSQYRK